MNDPQRSLFDRPAAPAPESKTMVPVAAPSRDSYRDRSPAQRQQILELLAERGTEGASNAELNNVCFRYGARIFELRKMGHKIRTVNKGEGMFRFVLEARGAECRDTAPAVTGSPSSGSL